MENTLHKEFTLELYKIPWWDWKAVRVKEMGFWHGFICWDGVSKMLPSAAVLLKKGYKVKVSVNLTGVE